MHIMESLIGVWDGQYCHDKKNIDVFNVFPKELSSTKFYLIIASN